MAGSIFGVKDELKYTKPNMRVYSPMLEALVKGNAERVKLFLKVGVNPNQRDAVGRTPLIIISYYTNENKAGLLARHLVKHGGKIDFTDTKGKNALHHACEKGRTKLVDTLLKYKDQYDITVQDKSGKTCFDYAEISGSSDISAMLQSLADEYCWSQCICSSRTDTAMETTSPINGHTKDFEALSKSDIGVTKSRDDRKLEKLPNVKNETKKATTCSHEKKIDEKMEAQVKDSEIETIGWQPEMMRSAWNLWAKKTRKTAWNIAKKNCLTRSLRHCMSEPHRREKNFDLTTDKMVKRSNSSTVHSNSAQRHTDGETAICSTTKQIDISKVGLGKEIKVRKHKSSKEQLVDIFKIFEQQKSVTYREGAKKPVIFSHSNSVSPMSSAFLEDDEVPRVPSGRSSRSMSLVPGAFPHVIGARKRRSSRVSLQFNVSSLPGEIKNKTKSLQQRRFSAISAPSFAFERSVSPRAASNLSMSAPIIPVIRKFNFDRTELFRSEREEKEAVFDKKEKFFSRKTIRKKISLLPSLQAFTEIGEGADIEEISRGHID
eukprot:gene4374-20597_t